jgi:gliding motility-associated-like protein
MVKIYSIFFICVFLFFVHYSIGQETLYYENFESDHSFTLNTIDNNSLGITGSNKWIVNNIYQGGTWYYSGFVPIQVPTTTSQPSSIHGSPYSHYLHTVCVDASYSGISNCNFIDAASSGFVSGNPGKIFAKMSKSISTIGYTNVVFSFWWVGNGGLGYILYSTTGGNTWNQLEYVCQNNTAWNYIEFSKKEFENIPDLQFGFMFTNLGGSNYDPGFAVDEIYIKASPINQAPIANFSTPEQVICQFDCINFEDLTLNQPTSWQWTFEQGLPSFSNIQHPTNICYNEAGNFPITLTVANEHGSDTLIQKKFITVLPAPQISLEDIYILNIGDSLIVDAGYFPKYLWSTGDTTQSVVITEAGKYSITIYSDNDCSFTHEFLVDTQYELIFPNIITPNGDGFNDTFEIQFIEKYSKNSLVIYNRWGNKVFEQSNYDNSWNGENLSEGTYFYVFKYDKKTYQGSLTIIR